MDRKRIVVLAVLVAFAAIAAGGASAASTGLLALRVPRHPSVTRNLSISFHPRRRLPRGGYYYAVAVLVDYPRYSPAGQPPCAVSSNMQKTEYGYPGRDGRVRLSLLPAPSSETRWCGGKYKVAVYAVPHPPPCSSAYPCYGKEAQSSCWEFPDGSRACGVVAGPECPEAHPGPGAGAREPPERTPECRAREAREREAREKTEREAKEKAEREARERAEREAAEKAQGESGGPKGKSEGPSVEAPTGVKVKPAPAQTAPPYSYPGGLPKPVDGSAHVLTSFNVTF